MRAARLVLLAPILLAVGCASDPVTPTGDAALVDRVVQPDAAPLADAADATSPPDGGAPTLDAPPPADTANVDSGRADVPVDSSPADVPVDASARSGADGLMAGYSCTCSVRSGTVRCWGVIASGMIPARRSVDAVVIPGVTDAVEVSMMYSTHACARRASGGVVCWGLNDRGQLGDGTTTSRPEPVAVVGLSDAVGLAVGDSFGCALRRGGEVVCWGANVGQRGEAGVAMYPAPVAVMGISDAVEIAAGGSIACARRAGGQALCWGYGEVAGIGGGGPDGRVAPTPVGEGVLEVDAGTNGVCLRLVDRVVCRGLFRTISGDGRPFPEDVAITGVTQVALGGQSVYALRADGTVVAWGSNMVGQLGVGTTRFMDTATPALGLTGVTAVTAHGFHACARLANGEARCWGANGAGELGDRRASGEMSLSPTAVTVD